MPPPMTSVVGHMSTESRSSGSWCLTRRTAARTRPSAFSVAAAGSSWTQLHCSRMLAISRRYGLRPAVSAARAERRLVHARAAGGDHHALEAVVGDVLGDHLLAGVGAHVLVRARHHDAGHGRRGLRDGVAVDHLGDVGAAVADEHADPWLCHGVHLLRPHAAVQPARRLAAPASSPWRAAPAPSPARCARYMASGPVGEVRPLAEGHLEREHRDDAQRCTM